MKNMSLAALAVAALALAVPTSTYAQDAKPQPELKRAPPVSYPDEMESAGKSGVPARPVPLANPGMWIRPGDYPASALRSAEEGRTSFRLEVGPDGVPTSCTVTVSSGSEVLDSTTCALIQERARFSPGHDKKGRPIAGTWYSAVLWNIPSNSTAIPAPHDLIFQTTIEADGSVSDCKVLKSEGPGPDPKSLCAQTENRTFIPATDASGKPIRQIVTTRSSITVTDAPQ